MSPLFPQRFHSRLCNIFLPSTNHFHDQVTFSTCIWICISFHFTRISLSFSSLFLAQRNIKMLITFFLFLLALSHCAATSFYNNTHHLLFSSSTHPLPAKTGELHFQLKLCESSSSLWFSDQSFYA